MFFTKTYVTELSMRNVFPTNLNVQNGRYRSVVYRPTVNFIFIFYSNCPGCIINIQTIPSHLRVGIPVSERHFLVNNHKLSKYMFAFTWHYWYLLKNNLAWRVMVTSNGEMSIVKKKHFEKRLHLVTCSFWERGNFSLKISKDSRPEAFYWASESTQSCATRVFFSFAIPLKLWWPILSQIITTFVIYAYVRIHQVRKPVFDNYQRCLVPLRKHISV